MILSRGKWGIITDSSRLEAYSDTSKILPRILAYPSTQKQLDSLIFFAEWLKNYDEGVALRYAQLAYDKATEKNWDIPRIISSNRIAWLKGNQIEYGEDFNLRFGRCKDKQAPP